MIKSLHNTSNTFIFYLASCVQWRHRLPLSLTANSFQITTICHIWTCFIIKHVKHICEHMVTHATYCMCILNQAPSGKWIEPQLKTLFNSSWLPLGTKQNVYVSMYIIILAYMIITVIIIVVILLNYLKLW